MQPVNVKSVFAQTKQVLQKFWLPVYILCTLPALLYLARVLSYRSVQTPMYYTALWAVQVIIGMFSAAAIMAILSSDGSLTWQQAYKNVKDRVMNIMKPAAIVVIVVAVLAGLSILTPQAMYIVYVCAPLFVLAGGSEGVKRLQKEVMANQNRWLVLGIHAVIFGFAGYYLNLFILRLLYQIVMSNLVIAIYFILYYSALWTLAFAYFTSLYKEVMGGANTQTPKVM